MLTRLRATISIGMVPPEPGVGIVKGARRRTIVSVDVSPIVLHKLSVSTGSSRARGGATEGKPPEKYAHNPLVLFPSGPVGCPCIKTLPVNGSEPGAKKFGGKLRSSHVPFAGALPGVFKYRSCPVGIVRGTSKNMSKNDIVVESWSVMVTPVAISGPLLCIVTV